MKDFIVSPLTDKKEARNKIIEAVNQLNIVEATVGKQPELEKAKEELSELADRLKLGNLDRLLLSYYK